MKNPINSNQANQNGNESRSPRQTAVLAGLFSDTRETPPQVQDDLMEELANLCAACEMEAVGVITQSGREADSATCLGGGKAEELANAVKSLDADLVVFCQELSASQIRSLEKLTGVMVLDRTALILEIFSRRAKTREARLQVETARLQYELPRLVGAHENLSRTGGAGAGSGMHSRGSGEQKLELDRRKIEAKIAALEKELKQLQIQRNTQTQRRADSALPQVALAGYTNAGKSTVMNALLSRSRRGEEKKVLQKDMLFATLDATIRMVRMPGGREFLLADTVGFVSHLPHTLVKAFRSTLQAVLDADVILHVIDLSNPRWEQQREITLETLQEIGAGAIPVLEVYNKIDLLPAGTLPDGSESLSPSPLPGNPLPGNPLPGKNKVFLSAQTGQGIEELLEEISHLLSQDHPCGAFLLPYSKGKEISYLLSRAQVLQREERDDGLFLRAALAPRDWPSYQRYIIAEQPNPVSPPSR